MLEHKPVPWVQIPCLRRSGLTSLQLSMLRPKSKQSLVSVLISTWTLHTLLPTLCGTWGEPSHHSRKGGQSQPCPLFWGLVWDSETVLKTLLRRCFYGLPHTPTIPILPCRSPYPLSVTLPLKEAPPQALKRSPHSLPLKPGDFSSYYFVSVRCCHASLEDPPWGPLF